MTAEQTQHRDGWLTATLAEYNTLRTEILQRATAQIQICTVAGTVAVAVVGFAVQTASPWAAVGLLSLEAFFLFVGMRFIHQDTTAAALRILELEQAVNAHLGEDTMVWEGSRGIQKVGYLERWRKVFDTTSRADDP